ncbi:TIR-like protein FxsC [Kitasatospora sp. NPDC057512]|uniref:TIR-like protein FxsC n=1 Tax=Kitasatospora sp. NPDC057512 TaxID=3346154 RepID=UPI00368D5195
MTSSEAEPAGPTGLARLAAVLTQVSGHRPSPTELAELLWLAGHSTHNPTPPPPGAAARQGTGTGHAPVPADDQATAPAAHLHAPGTTPVEPQTGTAPGPHLPLRTPAPPLLRRPLALQRALRPLSRRVPTTRGWELDEVRTAHRIAAHNAVPHCWLPVLRRGTERWLDLVIAFDDGPTMTVWRPLARELHHLAAQTGFFRTVRLLRVPCGAASRSLRMPASRPDRTVLLVVSDCAGPQWWAPGGTPSPWHRALRDRAATMATAVVQPLPERLWRRTALPATAGVFSPAGEAAPNANLGFTPYRADAAGPGMPVPVLEPTGEWLAHWAQLVSGRTGRVPGAAGRLLTTGSAAPEGEDPGRLSAQDLVLRFRAVASPGAFRLAGHLAVGVPHLPVMRLVQAAVEPRPRPQQLAELILSGLLTALPGADGQYAFRPGVREVLLRTLPRSAAWQTVDLLRRVGGYIEQHAGSARETFPAVAPSTGTGSGSGPAPDGPPFAVVSPDALTLLGGDHPGPPAPTPLPRAVPPLRTVSVQSSPTLRPGGIEEWSRPYFFFSYARRDFEAEDSLVDRFFNDLRDELGRLVGTGVRVEELAYRDTERLRLGDDWAEKLATMLGRSRTMVALYSPAYFASLYCGKEWTAFRGRVRRHHEDTGEFVPALLPVLWEPVEPGGLADEVNKIQWAQPDMGEAYARQGLRALLRTAQSEAYEQVVRVVAKLVRDAATRRLGELPEFDLGAVRGYFPAPMELAAASAPGMVRLFIAAGTSSEAAAAGGGWYGTEPWDWAPYHPPVQSSLVMLAQQVLTAAGHTTTLEEIDADLTAKVDQARENSEVSILLVDPWVAGSERYRSVLRAYDDQNRPFTGVILPTGSDDPADGPERDALWAGVRDVFRRNWLHRSDLEHLFRVKVSRENFDSVLSTMVTIAQNKLMDDNLDRQGDDGDPFGLGQARGFATEPTIPGLAVPAGPPGTRPDLPRPTASGIRLTPQSDRDADQP